MGASTTPLSPNTRKPITVPMLAAKKLTKLLPMRMTPNKRSGRLSRRLALRAAVCFCLTRWRNRYRLSAIIAVSLLEKYAESTVSVRMIATKMEEGSSVSDISLGPG